MNGTLITLATFFIALVIHVAIWRYLKPKKTIKILVSIFALFYPAELIILIASNAAVVDLFIATILFLGLVGAYMITYTGIEWDSPTINIKSSEKFGKPRID